MIPIHQLYIFCCVATSLVKCVEYRTPNSNFYFFQKNGQSNIQANNFRSSNLQANSIQTNSFQINNLRNNFPASNFQTNNFQANNFERQYFQENTFQTQFATESIKEKYFNLFLTLRSPDSVQHDPRKNADFLNRYRSSLSLISDTCPSDSCFSSYNPSHRAAVQSMTELYKDATDIGSFLDLCQFLRSRSEIHPQVWYTGFIRAQSALLPQALSMERPSPLQLFPTIFFPNNALQETTPSGECILVDETVGQDNGIENLLWYFREDVQMNANHWIWHLLYPINSPQRIDRRGEFFYFFHHELIARYAAERISNRLKPQEPLDIKIDTVVKEGYNPHLRDGVSSSNWAPRPPFSEFLSSLGSVNSSYVEDLYNLTINKNRFIQSLKTGSVVHGNVLLPIHTADNINILGEIAEASNHSINPVFYGMDGYHGQGHFLLANLIGNSPRGEIGVMGHNAAAMRDPIFYRWHKLIDILFIAYKATHLAPYALHEGEHPLVVNGITARNIRVVPNHDEKNVNLLHTFWNSRNFQLEGGLDLNANNVTSPRNVNVCAKHLDHGEFTYQIEIDNAFPTPTATTVRIFMAPRYKSVNKRIRYTMSEQRSLFFTMDVFAAVLQPGSNLIQRRSEDSTVTAPWPKSIEQIRQDISRGVRGRIDCECGYPHHLLLPKGTEEGMEFDLFVILTDSASDQVVESPTFQQQQQLPDVEQCVPSHVYCGISGRSYPDAKPMGYPFDRKPFQIPILVGFNEGRSEVKNIEVATLEDYVSRIPNAASTQIVIAHQNVQRGLESFSEV